MSARCGATTQHHDGHLGNIRVRCDLDRDHEGRHELRSRTSGELVTSWRATS